MAIFSTATKTEVVTGTEEQFEDLILDILDAERTDLIDLIETMIGGPLPTDEAGNLLLCSCRRKRPSPA